MFLGVGGFGVQGGLDGEATMGADVRVGGDAYGVGVFEVSQCCGDIISVG